MMAKLLSAWRWALNFFEHGDLIPFMIVVSVTHYVQVLALKDDWLSAGSIGLVVDLGHLRTIRFASRYKGATRWERVTRWAIAVIMTVVSFGYHYRFYGDWLLALPMPFLIGVLAWLPEPKQAQTANAEPSAAKAEPSKSHTANCTYPGCGWVHNHYQSAEIAQKALNGHMKAHAKENIA